MGKEQEENTFIKEKIVKVFLNRILLFFKCLKVLFKEYSSWKNYTWNIEWYIQ